MNEQIESILFIDIETVATSSSYEKLSLACKLFGIKANYLKKNEDDTAEIMYERAGIYAEFGKIVCISVAYKNQQIRTKSFYGHEENTASRFLHHCFHGITHQPHHRLCPANGKNSTFLIFVDVCSFIK